MKKLILFLLALTINLFKTEISIPLPVELTSFTSSVNTNIVTLDWRTVFESNNNGFFVERKNIDSVSWTQLGFVIGNGTTNVPHTYQFIDTVLILGSYNYRLKQVDFDNSFQYFLLNGIVIVNTISVSNNTAVIPDNFKLFQNYPNPFNPETMIRYELTAKNHVSLKVFSVDGKEVATLVNQNQIAGTHSVKFNASGLESGVYFSKLEVVGAAHVKKMVLIK